MPKPRKAMKEKPINRLEKKIQYRCIHVWKAEEHVHNKGKGKYQWYICTLCKGRQKRNYNRKRKNKIK